MKQTTDPSLVTEGLASVSVDLLDPDKGHYEMALHKGETTLLKREVGTPC